MFRTCSPAGSMVTTTSAPFTASTALGAGVTPSFSAASSDAFTRSKPRTWCCALTRLRAIGPPMLPRPMKPIFAMVPSLILEGELARAQAGEIAVHLHVVDRVQARWLPARLLVLVDHHGA